jgi:Protein of unknown function (DUF3108)
MHYPAGSTVNGARQARYRLMMSAALVPVMLGMSQSREPLPFAQGERLVYSAHAGPGMNAHAEMWVEGPVMTRGIAALVLHSEIRGGFGPVKVSDLSTSWIDPERMAALHFQKVERNPMESHSEDVEIDLDGRSWRAVDGRTGTSPSDQPLDELSFIYYLRTLRLPDDSSLVLNRHFDAERNPTVIRSLGAGSVETPAGTFATREIEMRVRDARRYRGEGIIRISLSDDACRRPVRIESRIPNAGKIVLELLSAEPACAAR